MHWNGFFDPLRREACRSDRYLHEQSRLAGTGRPMALGRSPGQVPGRADTGHGFVVKSGRKMGHLPDSPSSANPYNGSMTSTAHSHGAAASVPRFALADLFLEGFARRLDEHRGHPRRRSRRPQRLEAVTVQFAIDADAARDDLEALIAQAQKRAAGEGR
jgi:hypothetical protein